MSLVVQRVRVTVVTVALLCLFVSAADAVTVIVKNGGEPVRGFLVRQNDTEVVVNVPLPGGGVRETRIPIADVQLVLDPISKSRLDSLHQDKPQEYRNYAEELAEKKADPDARAMGIRLYLIAAYLDPEHLGASCFRGMTGLANDDRERAKYRAMVYLMDPDHDRALLTRSPSPPSTTGPTRSTDDDDQGLLREALKRLRQGKMTEARNFRRRPQFTKLLEPYRAILTLEEFDQGAVSRCPTCTRGRTSCEYCRGTGRRLGTLCPECKGSKKIVCARCRGNFREPGLPPALMKKVITLEMVLRGEDPSFSPVMAADRTESLKWSQVFRNGKQLPVPRLALEAITPYDPRMCHFRDGKWQEP